MTLTPAHSAGSQTGQGSAPVIAGGLIDPQHRSRCRRKPGTPGARRVALDRVCRAGRGQASIIPARGSVCRCARRPANEPRHRPQTAEPRSDHHSRSRSDGFEGWHRASMARCQILATAGPPWRRRMRRAGGDHRDRGDASALVRGLQHDGLHMTGRLVVDSVRHATHLFLNWLWEGSWCGWPGRGMAVP